MAISEQSSSQTSSTSLGEKPQHPAPRARVIKSLALLAMAVAILAMVNLARLDRLTGDQFTLLAVVNYEQDSSVYPGDGLFQDPSWFQSYLPWYRALTLQLTNWTGDGSLGLWLMSVGLTASMALAFWLLFYWLKVDPMLATLGAILGVLPRAATGSDFSGAGIIEFALPRTFFSVGLPLAIYLILKTHGRGRWAVAGFFLLGLLGNFHPQSAFFATAGLLILLLAQRWWQWKAWLQVSICGLASVVGVLPFGLSYPWEATSSKPTVSEAKGLSRLDALQNLLVVGGNSQPVAEESKKSVATLPSEEDREETSEQPVETPPSNSLWWTLVDHGHHALRLMNYQITLPVFLLAVVPMGLAVRVLRSDREEETSSFVSSARLCYLAAVLIGCLSMGSEFVNRLLGTWYLSLPFLDSVQPLRATRLVAPLCVTAFVLLLSKYKELESLALRRVQWGLLLLLFPVGVSMAGGEYVFQTRYQPVQEAAQWANENTEPGTLFLVNPSSAIAFRYWAKRPVVWAKHDAVCVPNPIRSKARKEISKIERAFKSKGSSRLMKLALNYNVDYVYWPERTKDPLPRGSFQVGPFLSLGVPTTTTRIANPFSENAKQVR